MSILFEDIFREIVASSISINVRVFLKIVRFCKYIFSGIEVFLKCCFQKSEVSIIITRLFEDIFIGIEAFFKTFSKNLRLF
jgi:hypothetical protein